MLDAARPDGSRRRIAVVGGRGTVGAHIAGELRRRGHDVITPSRSDPGHRVDLATGRGLDDALAGCDVVVDASDGPPRDPRRVLVDGTAHLLDAGRRAGVGHHVCVSINGIDAVPTKYYAAKLAQEALVEQADVPWTIVRATQFHELLTRLLEPLIRRWHLAVSIDARLQPVSAAEAGAQSAVVALGPAFLGRYVIAGPEIVGFAELSRALRRSSTAWALPLRVPLRPSLGRPLRQGALTCPQADHHGTVTFSDWLGERG